MPRKAARLLMVLPILAAGCIDPVSTVPVITWQGALEPSSSAGVPITGSVAMVANQFSTQMGIGVSAGPENTTLRWVVRSGSCSSPGNPVAGEELFPSLNLNDSGAGQVDFVLNRRINVSGTFATQVLDPSGQLLGCANLSRLD
jgi:hypothetical protein